MAVAVGDGETPPLPERASSHAQDGRGLPALVLALHDELLARDGVYRRLYALQMEGVAG